MVKRKSRWDVPPSPVSSSQIQQMDFEESSSFAAQNAASAALCRSQDTTDAQQEADLSHTQLKGYFVKPEGFSKCKTRWAEYFVEEPDEEPPDLGESTPPFQEQRPQFWSTPSVQMGSGGIVEETIDELGQEHIQQLLSQSAQRERPGGKASAQEVFGLDDLTAAKVEFKLQEWLFETAHVGLGVPPLPMQHMLEPACYRGLLCEINLVWDLRRQEKERLEKYLGTAILATAGLAFYRFDYESDSVVEGSRQGECGNEWSYLVETRSVVDATTTSITTDAAMTFFREGCSDQFFRVKRIISDAQRDVTVSL